MKNEAFTLIELMVVIGIIAILAAISSSKFGSQLLKAKDAKPNNKIANIIKAINIFI